MTGTTVVQCVKRGVRKAEEEENWREKVNNRIRKQRKNPSHNL